MDETSESKSNGCIPDYRTAYQDKREISRTVWGWIGFIALVGPAIYLQSLLPGWLQVLLDPRLIVLALMLCIVGLIALVFLAFRAIRSCIGKSAN